MNQTNNNKWQFWIDRGGTFTDIVAKDPDGQLIPYKLLSENPERYNDAAIQGIRNILNLSKNDNIPVDQIECVKMGTTVATNALLERKGERTLLIINEGFKDALRIAYQTRPRLFDLNITLPELLYEDVAELSVRTAADGKVTQNLNPDEVHKKLLEAYKKGIRSCAIVLMHGYRYPEHETKIANIARDIGYEQISLSHETSPLIKLISRGDTTVVDAYLSPILRHYVNLVADELGQTTLMFMQSNGGLIRSDLFQGKDSILSGPAGGIVGAVKVAHNENLEKIIAFDMGGTSTDVAHYSNEYERSFETEVAGVRMRVPMMNIHTVAAGGGSVLSFDGTKYKVGPESAGANPGPASYKRGGPLTVTDCNVMLGKIQPAFFPHVFGPNADQPLDYEIVNEKFEELSSHIHKLTGDLRSPHEVAEGFLKIAVDNMANAIKKISVQRGYDITDYTLSCYGGASGQHACLVADALGMQKIYIDNLAGVLSAYGMGLADIRALREKSIEKPLETNLDLATKTLDELCVLAGEELKEQDIESYKTHRRLHIKYAGTDTSLIVPESNLNEIEHTFNAEHKSRFGFIIEGKALEIETVSVELVGVNEHLHYSSLSELNSSHDVGQEHHVQIFTSGTHNKAPIIKKGQLSTNQIIQGPAIIADNNTTIVIEPEWQASMTKKHNLILTRIKAKNQMLDLKTDKDPVMLEIFNNLYMSIAEQMGKTLENTAYSINIKERLDFSCAVFDHTGSLIANAPHMPVHLGSMGMAVKNVIDQNKTMKKGDVYMVNDPYNGGTHLPDITIITPVFYGHEINAPIFYVASRGHHADIGGLTPGSMPPDSCSIEEEGILFNNFLIVKDGEFQENAVIKKLSDSQYPARNIHQNIGDLKAQIAANEKGVLELTNIVNQFSLKVVTAYMDHIRDNAEEKVRQAIEKLKPGSFTYNLDNGAHIKVTISIDKEKREATVDFTGTSAQLRDNFNAPLAITRAAVLYVFRTLVGENIPMNDGCLEPIHLIVPESSMLNPDYPAAVVAGNVETSQCITDCLYGALGVIAGSQGTMNNFTFGDNEFQYYETICGGSGAGPNFHGTDAIHTHMTNSKLTDPEVLENRYPVMLESFSIKEGTGGHGLFHGGNGVVRKVKFLRPMSAAILSNHRKIAPFGLHGGQEGATGKTSVLRLNGKVQTLASSEKVHMEAGESFIIQTPGGGGFGREEPEP